ncbi:MAG: terminase [Sphingomicrobium sp.]
MSEAAIASLDEASKYLSPEEFAELKAGLEQQAAQTVFVPTPRQKMVLDNEADVIGYGGAAGGGKSFLVAGMTTLHTRSCITRPQKNQTKKFVQELHKMLGSRDGYSQQNSNWDFKTPDGAAHYVEFYGLDNPGDEEKQQGVDFDLKAYDEVTQMRESDIRYTLTWNRTDDPLQRVRAVLTFNPPTTPEGRWVIKFFAPWLDKAHPRPAKDGELRWFATVGNDQDYEVAGPQPFIVKQVNGIPRPWYNFRPEDHLPEEIIIPKSRTFIHAKVTDNPYYMRTGYMAQLQNLPEPLRSQMLRGDFTAGMEDAARQVIPSNWILAAQERWREREALYRTGAVKKGPQDSLGVDAARGGNMGAEQVSAKSDELVVSPRYGTFFDELKIFKGLDINDGSKAAAVIIGERRDDATVHIDVVGIGTSPYDFLQQNHIDTIAVNGATSAWGTDKSGLLRFFNRRAELYWRLREDLDPQNPEPIALPPDPQLAGDLAAPCFVLGKSGIQIESTDDIKKKIGRSPDRGTAVVLANITTPKRGLLIGPYKDAPSHASESYEQRRLRELENGG